VVGPICERESVICDVDVRIACHFIDVKKPWPACSPARLLNTNGRVRAIR